MTAFLPFLSYCGSELSNGASLSKTSTASPMPCAGDAQQTCGGASAMTLVYNSAKLDADLSPKAGVSASSTASSAAAAASSTASAGVSSGTLPAGYKSVSSSLIAEGKNGRALISASTSSQQMTPAFCASYCSNLGFGLSGTEYSTEWLVSAAEPSTPSCLSLTSPCHLSRQLLRQRPL